MSINANEQSITPYFTVRDADQMIDFMVSVFDTELIKEDRYENGRIQHARLILGNSPVMLNEANEDYPANVSQMHLYVEDAESSYLSTLQHGATSIMEPNLRPHGDWMSGVKDPCGNIWWLASQPS